MKTRFLSPFIAFLIGAGACCAGYAQSSRFRNGQLLVLEATSFVNERQNTVFSLGDEMLFTRAPRPVATGRAAESSVSVRIFALNPGETVPSAFAVFEPCWVYMSYLADVKINASGTIRLFALDERWLRATKGASTVQAGHYLVVFEKGGGDGHGLIRIHRGDRDEYFRHGLKVQIDPRGEFTQTEVDAMAEKRAAQTALALAAARINDPKSTCYITRLATVSDLDADASVIAMNDDCGPEQLAP